MAKNNTNTTPLSAKPQGFKTRKGANNKSEPTVITKVRSQEDIQRRRANIITAIAAVLIVAIVACITGVIIAAIVKGDEVDYLKDNLNKYINISKDDYTGIEIDIPLMEYSDDMVTAEINRLIVEHKEKTALENGLGSTEKPVALGDVISYRYRIYTVDENGKETEVSGYCNFNDTTNATLEIGSQKSGFLGLEEALIGVVPKEHKKFEKIKEGTVSTGDVIYLTYTAFYPTGAASSASYERIDLSRDNIDSIYGEGFRNFMIGSAIGEKLSGATFKTADGSIGYTDMKVEFATQCEKDCVTLDIVFSADHNDNTEVGYEMRGVSAKMDVYIDNAVKYQTPEYNESFITEKLGMTEADLSSYDGADITEKHKAYLKASVLESIDKTNERLISEALWEKLSTKGEVIEYPKADYDRIYDAYYTSVENYYNQSASAQSYPSIDSAAIDYFGLSSGADWQEHINTITKKKLKEDLIVYYIIRKEGFLPTDAEYEAEYNLLLDEYIDYYLGVHAEEFKKFEGAEYDEQLRVLTEEIKGVYGDSIDYNVYKNVLLRKMQNDSSYVTVKK